MPTRIAYFSQRYGSLTIVAAAARSASTVACSWLMRPAGIAGSRREQLHERPRFVAASHQPQNSARAIDNWISKCHSSAALVNARERHVHVAHVQHGIARHERSRVTIGPEAQVDQIDHGRSAGEPVQCGRVRRRGRFEIVRLDRHRMNLIRL